jgi:hypothetical protein
LGAEQVRAGKNIYFPVLVSVEFTLQFQDAKNNGSVEQTWDPFFLICGSAYLRLCGRSFMFVSFVVKDQSQNSNKRSANTCGHGINGLVRRRDEVAAACEAQSDNIHSR